MRSTPASSPTILIVEDEPTLAETLAFNLERQGYQVAVERDGLAAIASFERQPADLLLLDAMLPGLDGFEVCRRIRARSSVPILMLTARADEVDRVLGLEIGADDYVTKPFGLRELQARIRALLRRSRHLEPPPTGQIESRDLRLSTDERRAWRENQELRLRPREFDLLAFLMRNRGIALSRRQILDAAWDPEFLGDERTVDVHIRALREAVESEPSQPSRITTVRGVGYRFEG